MPWRGLCSFWRDKTGPSEEKFGVTPRWCVLVRKISEFFRRDTPARKSVDFLLGSCTATNIAKPPRLSAQCLPSLALTALFPALGLDSWPSRNTSQVKPVKSNLSPSLAGCSGVFVGPEAWIKKFGVKGLTTSTLESLTGKVLKL